MGGWAGVDEAKQDRKANARYRARNERGESREKRKCGRKTKGDSNARNSKRERASGCERERSVGWREREKCAESKQNNCVQPVSAGRQHTQERRTQDAAAMWPLLQRVRLAARDAMRPRAAAQTECEQAFGQAGEC